jgi:pyridoxamine 5'-phosphate oxidase
MSTRQDVADLRRDYKQGSLEESQVASDPIAQFEQWFQAAVASEVPEPNAMALSTVASGRPATRIVLLKDFDARGFVFYTNYESRKGREIAANPAVALTFWWAELERQIRIEGTASPVSAEESDAYFFSRPRGSRLGAWASPQSQPIQHRDVLEQRAEQLQQQYGEHTFIPRPPHWGGFRVVPDYLEFWQGRSSRLHDRIAYRQGADGQWERERLAP